MNHQEISSLACSMMDKHGLMLKGWTFEFDNAVKRLGCTHYGPKKITMSRKASLLMTEYEVKQIMLHEIAHALLPGVKHGKRWKDLAKSLGYELGVKVIFEQHQEDHQKAVEESNARYAEVLRRDRAKAVRIRRRDSLTGSTAMTIGSIVVFKLDEYEVKGIHRKFATVKRLSDNVHYKIAMSHISQTVIHTPTAKPLVSRSHSMR